MNISLDMLSIRERLSFLNYGTFQGFVDSSIRMRTQDSYDFFEKNVSVLYLACSATMFLSLAECGSYGDGIIKISPVFLSTSLASSFFSLDFCFVC